MIYNVKNLVKKGIKIILTLYNIIFLVFII